MIALIKGEVLEKEDKALIVDAGGLGYRVQVLPTLLTKSLVGSTVNLKIYHQISSDKQALYGFLNQEELRHFELLLTVPSVGPRTAMGILEAASPRVLGQAVAEGDTALLTKVSGVGKKTAERILVELKEKVELVQAGQAVGTIQQELIEALMSIGYTGGQARSSARKLPAEVKTVEEAVRIVLQRQNN